MSEANREGFHVSQIFFFLTLKVDKMVILWEFMCHQESEVPGLQQMIYGPLRL